MYLVFDSPSISRESLVFFFFFYFFWKLSNQKKEKKEKREKNIQSYIFSLHSEILKCRRGFIKSEIARVLFCLVEISLICDVVRDGQGTSG